MLNTLFKRLIVATICLFLSSHASSQTPWPNAPFQAGPIQYEFGIYYLGKPGVPPVHAAQQRLEKATSNFKLRQHGADTTDTPWVTFSLTTNAQKDYTPPSLSMTQRFGRGLTHEQATALSACEQALILDFGQPAKGSMSNLKAALTLTEQIARDTNGLIWDEETREIFTPDAWHKRRLESWLGDVPDVSMHTVIHAYKADQLVRAITLGMIKFGMPDVVISDFSWSLNRPMGNLINVFSQAIVEGQPMKGTGEFDLDLNAIRHEAVRERQTGTLKEGGKGFGKLQLVKGTWESGDPRNRLVEIGADRYPGEDKYARQESMLTSIFGSEDESIARLKHTEALTRVSKAALAKMPALREAFNRGLQPGEYILVKAPFTTSAKGREWMWVEVMNWQGDQITGLLKNEPIDVPGLHAGQKVRVSQADLFDYIRRFPDGQEEGNETGKLIMQMQSAR
ncbi:MAG TPA: DUF2314 domain-containing protein [Aquabacterium sp.]|uniref:DUF2314 domain-containing protein n=1 Tax=Aquabacterium sp. TaxID=1872578 RepID=UPI002E36C8F8|nr:DUF2314 domain-containing protein [Aquabacterium sp.]HEX5357383.1 DUF2314 domain-containing protein [Aquabacterium sp.]